MDREWAGSKRWRAKSGWDGGSAQLGELGEHLASGVDLTGARTGIEQGEFTCGDVEEYISSRRSHRSIRHGLSKTRDESESAAQIHWALP